MRSDRPRPKWPNQVITNNYLPPRGPEPPRVEISVPGEEEVKKKLRRWEPFHPGASAADQLNSLYPPMNRVPVAARGMGLHSSGDTLFNYGYDCCAFTYNICGNKPQISNRMPNPSVPLTTEFFANPYYPPGPSAAASSLDHIVVDGEERSKNSPAATEEAVLPMDQAGMVLPMDQAGMVLPMDQVETVLSTDQEKAILPTNLPTK